MMIEYWCSHCDKYVQARVTDDSIESPEEIDLTNALCEECEKNGEFPKHGEFSQAHCDRCGSFVGITGLWLVWKEIAYDKPLYGYEWRPFLLCRGCKDEVDPDGIQED